MLMKYLASFSGRHSYSVGKVLVQHVKSRECRVDNIYNCINIVSSKCMSRKAVAVDPGEENQENPKGKADGSADPIREKVAYRAQSKRKVADDIYNYLSQSCDIEVLKTIPRRYFRRNSVPVDHIIVADTSVAEIIVKHVERNSVKKEIVVLETNPGMGILSKKLLAAGVSQMHLHEPSPVFFKILKDIFDCHSHKVKLHATDFLSIWKLAFQDKMDSGTRVQDLLSPYPKGCWTDDPYLKIITSLQSVQFIKHLIFSLISQSGIMMHCRPELFILMPPLMYTRLTCSGEMGYNAYRSLTVLFQLFFDYELLEQIPRKAFLPWKMPRSDKKRKMVPKLGELNEEVLYFVKVVPKRDLYTEVVSPDKICALWYFVRHHFWNRSKKLIPEMESWIPGCGVRLILEGYDIYTQFGDLKPEEVLHVFKLFSSWPEYQDCSFLSSMETALLKMEEHADNKNVKKTVREDEDDASENVDGEDR